MSAEGLNDAVSRMRDRGVDRRAIAVFADYYRQLESNATGHLPEDTIDPLRRVPRLEDLGTNEEARHEALARTVVLKLNGGLGTSMGIEGPKSALSVREGLTFLDIIARQVLALRARYGVDLPLLLMNSFRTREESLRILARHPGIEVDGIPLDFLQNAEPKLRGRRPRAGRPPGRPVARVVPARSR